MCFFKKKRNNDFQANLDDGDLVNQIHGGLKSIMVRAGTEDVKEEAQKIFTRIEYMPVSPKPSVAKIDQKIINQLSEVNVVLNKDANAAEKALAILQEIDILLINREVAYKSHKD